MKTNARRAGVQGGHEYLVCGTSMSEAKVSEALACDEGALDSRLVLADAPPDFGVRQVWQCGACYAMVYGIKAERGLAVDRYGLKYDLDAECVRLGWHLAPSLKEVPDLDLLNRACDEARGTAARERRAYRVPAVGETWRWSSTKPPLDLVVDRLLDGAYLASGVEARTGNRYTITRGEVESGECSRVETSPRLPKAGEEWHYEKEGTTYDVRVLRTLPCQSYDVAEGLILKRGHLVVTAEGETIMLSRQSIADGHWTLTHADPAKPGLDGLYPHQQVSMERMKAILKLPGSPAYGATRQVDTETALRESISSLSSKGPRWTRDGFDRCRGPSHDKWLRFLAATYEQARVTRQPGYRAPAAPTTTEAEVDAFFAEQAKRRCL